MNRRNKPMALRRQNASSYKRNQNITPYVSVNKIGPFSQTLMIALMVAVLGMIYLTQATRTTSFDYDALAIDQEIAELSAKKTDLEIEQARLTSLKTIETSEVAQAMVQPSAVGYVSN